jgi:hypothetical protein
MYLSNKYLLIDICKVNSCLGYVKETYMKEYVKYNNVLRSLTLLIFCFLIEPCDLFV